MTTDKPEKINQFSRTLLGFDITLDNGWNIDAQFGAGNYASNYRKFNMKNMPVNMESPNCETIIIDGNGVDRTFEIAHELNIPFTGGKNAAVIPYLKINDWLRIVNHINKIPKSEVDAT